MVRKLFISLLIIFGSSSLNVEGQNLSFVVSDSCSLVIPAGTSTSSMFDADLGAVLSGFTNANLELTSISKKHSGRLVNLELSNGNGCLIYVDVLVGDSAKEYKQESVPYIEVKDTLCSMELKSLLVETVLNLYTVSSNVGIAEEAEFRKKLEMLKKDTKANRN